MRKQFSQLIKSLLVFLVLLVWISPKAVAECDVVTVKGDGFSVTVSLELVEVVVNSDRCSEGGGYNYDVKIDYNISFTGEDPLLYTLQGYVDCGELFFDLPNGGGSGFVYSQGNASSSCDVPSTLNALGCSSYSLVIEGRGIDDNEHVLACEPFSEAGDCVEVVEIGNGNHLYIYRCDGEFTMSEDHDDVEVLVVGGGGGGGYGESAGGGGAGAMVYEPVLSLNPGQTYSVVVGNGGNGASNELETGANGEDSSMGGVIAIGGGGGGSSSNQSGVQNGKSGGSGGGGAAFPGSHGQGGEHGQGSNNAGGNGSHSGMSDNRAGGGGGGAGSSGDAGGGGAGNNPGRGGQGASSSIFDGLSVSVGIDNIFAAGGGGTGRKNSGEKKDAEGGSGIGGNGNAFGIGGSGKSNTGSGGGAGTSKGGVGASGIVIIRESSKLLPVQWKSIQVEYLPEGRKVKVFWATFTESGVSHFEIERLVESVDEFRTVGKVAATGWSEQASEYQYLDQNIPVSGDKIYYRIKEVGLNGKVSYSRVYSLKIPSRKPEKGVWLIYPNPSTDNEIHLELVKPSSYSGEPIVFSFISSLSSTDKITVKDINGLSAKVKEKFMMLSKGLWMLEIQWGEQVEYIKVLKR